jgi:Lysyl oxidase
MTIQIRRSAYISTAMADLQGTRPGWVGQYNQAIEGQELDISGIPAGSYYLVSTANPDHTFIETDPDNNSAWTSFDLKRDKQGHPKNYNYRSFKLCGWAMWVCA